MHLPLYTHHECPVTVLSPEDSRAEIDYPGVECRFGGLRAYIGQASLDRQIEHLKILLTYPENHFLIHDSDSVCLDAKLPGYLYAEPDVVWSNQVFDNILEHQPYFPSDWPHVAFQPPYFLSRQTIEKMIAVKDHPFCKASPCMPFIDFFMVQLTMVAGLTWRRFPDCLSFGICADPHKKLDSRQQTMYSRNTLMALNAVRNEGVQIIHSVKDPKIAEDLYVARQQFLGTHDAKPRLTLLLPQIVGGSARSRHTILRRERAAVAGQTGMKA
jgi:hypothetical protein